MPVKTSKKKSPVVGFEDSDFSAWTVFDMVCESVVGVCRPLPGAAVPTGVGPGGPPVLVGGPFSNLSEWGPAWGRGCCVCCCCCCCCWGVLVIAVIADDDIPPGPIDDDADVAVVVLVVVEVILSVLLWKGCCWGCCVCCCCGGACLFCCCCWCGKKGCWWPKKQNENFVKIYGNGNKN